MPLIYPSLLIDHQWHHNKLHVIARLTLSLMMMMMMKTSCSNSSTTWNVDCYTNDGRDDKVLYIIPDVDVVVYVLHILDS